MNLREPTRTAAVLLAFAAVFIALAAFSYTRESATWDEPQHLVAGYTALKLGDYRIDPEHPPFLRMWAALPLLFTGGIQLDTNSASWHTGEQWGYCHTFLYKQNDADRLLYRSRFMIALLGVVLGVLVFCWVRELFGFVPATITLGLYTVEPNLLAHARLVTTDFGVTCFIFGTLYFLWRLCRQVSAGNAVGLFAFFVLAQVSKFTALVLGPVVLVLWLVHAVATKRWRNLRLALFGVVMLAGVSYLAIWTVYRFRYAPTPEPAEVLRFQTPPLAQERIPALTTAIEWVDRHYLLPNAYVQGFLLGQAKGQKRASFLAGSFSDDGWWYYFPVAFLIKTSIALILLFFLGSAFCVVRWRTLPANELFLLVPLAAYLAVAMSAKLNIGLRHILPIYPFVLMLAGKGVAEIWSTKQVMSRAALGLVLAWGVVEFAIAYPHCLAFFNSSIGGPRNGYKYLADSNLDWGQDLKPLRRWMEKRQISDMNLSYFGTADPAYYRIQDVPLPGAPYFDESRMANPRLPGYVAVSATNLQGVYLAGPWRTFYHPLMQVEPVAVIGYSIYVYWVERPWW